MRSNWGSSRGRSPLNLDWQGIPVTRALIFASLITFLVYFFLGQNRGVLEEWITFTTVPPFWYSRPWTWLTYPLLDIPAGLFGWVFYAIALYIMYSMGGMLERSWASRNYVVLLLASNAIGALAFVLPCYLMGRSVSLNGLYLPINAVITAWAALAPDEEVCFWGIPMQAKFVALAMVAIVYFQMGLSSIGPILALFSAASPLAAWIYVRKLPRLNIGFRAPRPQRRREPLLRESPEQRERVRGNNPFSRRQEQQEIERLRKLLGEDGDDFPARRS